MAKFDQPEIKGAAFVREYALRHRQKFAVLEFFPGKNIHGHRIIFGNVIIFFNFFYEIKSVYQAIVIYRLQILRDVPKFRIAEIKRETDK